MKKDLFEQGDFSTTKISMSFLKANLLAFIYAIPMLLLFLAIYVVMLLVFDEPVLGHLSPDHILTNVDILAALGIFLAMYYVAFFLLIVIHEWLHALFFLRGCDDGLKSIKFGIKKATPYCHCREVLSLRIYRQSLLAPVFLICLPLAVLTYLTGSFVFFVLTVSMILGSGGDLAIYWKSRRYVGRTTYVWDMVDEVGCLIYQKNST